MKLQYKISLFVFLILLEAYFDPYIKQCDSLYGKFLMFFHHFVVIFSTLFSLLFGFYLIHFLVVFAITVLYILNKNCVLSFYHNHVCNFEKNTRFSSWMTYICRYFDINQVSCVAGFNSIILSYDLYMIFFTKKNVTLL
jgi:hypothetical protein